MFAARATFCLFVITGISPTAHACTPEQALAEGADAYDRAKLVEMVDVERGRALLKRLLMLHVLGLTSGPNVDLDEVCAEYDAVQADAQFAVAALSGRRGSRPSDEIG